MNREEERAGEGKAGAPGPGTTGEVACPAVEQGPIRPPSEAGSLLLRVTRNCPWNRCRFCDIYRGRRFTPRGLAEVCREIDLLAAAVERLRGLSWRLGQGGRMTRSVAAAAFGAAGREEEGVLAAAFHWLHHDGETVFLQDANSLVLPAERLAGILSHLRRRFPAVRRVTSYARSATLARLDAADLQALRRAGLDRVHVGLETGHDPLLRRMDKGVTAEEQVAGGRKALAAGLELSEYVMPGLGGKELWREHARDTATVLSRIRPHFIRLRSTVVHPGLDLHQDLREGRWTPLGDDGTAREIGLLLEGLEGCAGSTLASDHLMNLLPEVEGSLPEHLPRMKGAVDEYLALPAGERLLFRVGRRAMLFARLADLASPALRARALLLRDELQRRPGGVEEGLRELLASFV